MKKVIFVCLLSLSVCLSKANQTQEAQVPPAVSPTNPPTTNAKVPAAPEHPQTVAVETKAANGTVTVTPPATQTQNATVTTNSSQTALTPNETITKKNETQPAKDNATETKTEKDAPKPSTTDDKKVLPPQTNNETKPLVPNDKANNGTNADNKDGKKNETSTSKAEVVSPTTTPAPIQAKSRAFDGPSFIGGIILTLGLLAIGFMGFKYYKNQTERNYHTL